MLQAWVILIGVCLLILLFGIYVLLYRKNRLGSRQIKNIRKYWAEVLLLVKHNPEQAILRADKLLEHTLSTLGFSGSMAEKLKKARHIFHDQDIIWSAHKVRNKIAHEVHFQVTPFQAQGAIKGFQKAFHDLGVDV